MRVWCLALSSCTRQAANSNRSPPQMKTRGIERSEQGQHCDGDTHWAFEAGQLRVNWPVALVTLMRHIGP
jgi:hypothetical protein